MTSKHILFHIVTGLVLALFIISVSVTAALNFRFIYYSDIDRYELDKVSGLSKEELREDYNVLIDYNSVWGDDVLDLPHFSLSENAAQHFREAKMLFLFFAYGVPVFGLLTLALIIFALKKQYGSLYLAAASAVTLVLPAVLGASAVLAWDRFFVLFHELSFGNDLWMFDPAVDPVINVLPTEFFFHEAIAIFGLVILGGLICLLLYIKARRSAPSAD